MFLQNKPARFVYEHTFRAEHPETSTLRVQFQVTHTGPLWIVSLSKGNRCAGIANKKGLNLPLARVCDKEQALFRPFEYRLVGVNDWRTLAGDQ